MYFLNELDTKIYKGIGGVIVFVFKLRSSLTAIRFSFCIRFMNSEPTLKFTAEPQFHTCYQVNTIITFTIHLNFNVTYLTCDHEFKIFVKYHVIFANITFATGNLLFLLGLVYLVGANDSFGFLLHLKMVLNIFDGNICLK